MTPDNSFGLVNKLQLENLYPFGPTTLSFGPGLVMVKGDVGVGKTLLLRLLATVLSPTDLTNLSDPCSHCLGTGLGIEEVLSLAVDPSLPVVLSVDLSSPPNGELNTSTSITDSFVKQFLVSSSLQYQLSFKPDRRMVPELLDPVTNRWVTLVGEDLVSWNHLLRQWVLVDYQLPPLLPSLACVHETMFSPAGLFDLVLTWLDLGEVRHEFYQLQMKLQDVTADLGKLQSKFDQAGETTLVLQSKVDLQRRLQKLRAELSALLDEKVWSPVADLNDQIQSREERLAMVRGRQKELGSAVEETQEMIGQLEEEIMGVEEQLAEATTAYEEARQHYLNEKALIDQLDRKTKDWSNNIDRTDRQLRFQRMKLADKQRRLKELEVRISAGSAPKDAEDLKAALDKEVRQLEQTLEQTQEKADASHSERNRRKREKQRKEERLTPLNERLIEAEKNRQQMLGELTERKKKLEEHTEKLSSLEAELDQSQSQEESIVAELSDLRKQLEEVTEHANQTDVPQPSEVRSGTTLEVIESQLRTEIAQLQEKGVPEDANEVFQQHQQWLEQLGETFEQRRSDYSRLEELFGSWEDNWQKVVANAFEEFQNAFNSFCQPFFSAVEVEFSPSVLPEEGYLMYRVKKAEGSYIKVEELSNGEQLLLASALAFSLATVAAKPMILLDHLVTALPSSKLAQSLLGTAVQVIQEKGLAKDFFPQIVVTTVDFVVPDLTSVDPSLLTLAVLSREEA